MRDGMLTLLAASEARTRYWYVVFDARPASTNEVWVPVAAIRAKAVQPMPWHRWMTYPVTPTLSVAGLQRTVIAVPLAVAVTVRGGLGARESAPDPPPPGSPGPPPPALALTAFE